MSEHTISLSKHTYQFLLDVAKKQGLTPEDWILFQLAQSQTESRPFALIDKGQVAVCLSKKPRSTVLNPSTCSQHTT